MNTKTNLLKLIFISLILVLGVSNACGYNEYNKQYLYFDGSEFTSFFSDNCTPYISPKWDYNCSDGNSNGGDKQMTSITSKKYYYLDLSKSSSSYKSFRGFYIGRSANFYNGASMGVVDGSTSNCIKATGWGTYEWTNFAPPMSSASIENKSTVYGGDGTSNNPYQIKKGAIISVQASATSSVPNDPQTTYYRFYKKENSGTRSAIGNQSTTTTSSFTASSTVGTKYAVDVEARNEYYDTYGEKATSSTLYFITIEPIYAILGSFNSWAHSANTWDLSDQGSNNWKATFHLDKGSHTFKVVHNSSYYGKNNTTITRASATASSLSTSEANINLRTDIAGNYTFTFNSSTKNLTVTYPTAYIVTYGVGTNKGTDEVTTTPSITSGSLVLASTSITFSKGDTKAGYTWKNWNSKNDGTGTVLGTGDTYVSSDRAGDITVYACYDLVGYTVTLDPQEGTGGTASVSAKLNNPMPEIELPTRDAYDFGGYYDAEGGQGTQYYKPDGTSAKNWDKTTDATLYAHWIPTEYNITYELNGGTNHASNPKTYNITQEITLQDPTYMGHIFKGWFDNADFTGDAILSISAGSTGAKTFYAKWEIGTYEITLDLQQGTGGTQTISATFGSEMPAITTPTREGYLFNGYYDQIGGKGTKYYDETGKNIKNWNKESATLYAYWVPYSQCIFFKNTLGWKNVYVYTFSNNVWYDNEDSNTQYGPGVCTKVNVLEFAKMTQIDNTDIYYYILTKQAGFNHIAFSDADMNDWNEFYGNNAIYRADRNDQLPLFIPKKSQTPTTTNSTKYYSSGIWMKYNSTESGYDWRGATDQNNQEEWSKKYDFTASKPGGYSFTATVEFNNTSTHYFKIHNTKGDWFGNGGTMTQDNCTDWTFGTNNTENAKITPTITGKYIFTVYLGDGEVSVSLDYPLSVNDYRLVYVDDVTGAHPGHYIKKRNEERLDTVSFFVHSQNSPRIWLQHCTAIDQNGNATWATDKEYQILKTSGANPATAQLPGKRKSDAVLHVGEGCGIEESGVYNFVLKQSNSQAELFTDATHPYVGNFYIRTDAAEGGWDSFRQKSNQITYSSFADKHSNFNHYYCKYIEAGRNVKFTIANDYSYCISDTLDNDDIIKEGQSSIGCLPINANVRFGWDSNTNEISRAYIKGAGMASDRFLVLQGQDNNLKDANGNDIPEGTEDRTGLKANEEILVDQQNWIYQVDVTATKETYIKLIAEYNKSVQYFKGNAENYARLLNSTTTKSYKIRLIYDFKSNHLVTAWLAGGTVDGEQELGADMMVIRKDQKTAEQLNFNPLSELNEVGTGYAVMTFTKAHLENLQEDNENPLPENQKKTERERSLYWVSFPFDVKISDVFGFGEYAEHWIIQYYDGAERAEKGLFSDSGTYWKYIFDTDTVLHAGKGYVLVLDLNKIEFLHGATEVSLYFPSIDELNTISGELPTEATVPEHWCNIDRVFEDGEKTYNHKFTDSHWNLIGVPGFADIKDFDVTQYSFMQDDASFYYNFSLANSTYTVESSNATNFQAMYAYMVQFAGTINWSTPPKVSPAELAARRYSDDQPEKVVLRLELTQGEEVADRTFIQMQQEGATANFDLSLDLTKIVNIGVSNIYTLTDSLKIQTAGNVLPFEETTVAVGVDIATAGEYTFRMPNGTEGMVVELIDYETNTRTNLLLSDYTTTLPQGICENRFALSVKPDKVATDVEHIGEGVKNNGAAKKYIIDGKLFLQKDNTLYDAQGHIVR